MSGYDNWSQTGLIKDPEVARLADAATVAQGRRELAMAPFTQMMNQSSPGPFGMSGNPASLINLLLASMPPRPAPPGPNIFNPATFMAPVSTGGNSMFQLPPINAQSQSDIASAFQPFQQNALRIGGSNLAYAVPQVGVLGEPAQTLTGSQGTSSLAGGFNPAASLFNTAVQSPFSQTRTGK